MVSNKLQCILVSKCPIAFGKLMFTSRPCLHIVMLKIFEFNLIFFKVQEEDCLPKIICSVCVEKLEGYFEFREACVNAEAMLESYFQSLRYSDDITREGKVSVRNICNFFWLARYLPAWYTTIVLKKRFSSNIVPIDVPIHYN